jgi:hypothetical protein
MAKDQYLVNENERKRSMGEGVPHYSVQIEE